MEICHSRDSLPVLYEADLVILGSSFGGIAAALSAARSGLRVMLVESRTYLGREATATNRPWFELNGEDRNRPLPDLVQSCIQAAGTPEQPGGIIPLKIAELKIHLEDLLLQAGVKILYASHLVDVLHPNGSVEGIILGNKSGRQVVKTPAVIDATEASVEQGAIVPDGDSVALVTADGWLRLDEVQPSGRGRMSGPAYRRGRR